MNLLFDENLSPRLAERLADVFPGSVHVHECGLGSGDDDAIWQYAKENGFTIVSKDSAFQERSVLQGFPPKFIWLRAGNCTSTEIETRLWAAARSSPGLCKRTKNRAWCWEFVPRNHRDPLSEATLLLGWGAKPRGKSGALHSQSADPYFLIPSPTTTYNLLDNITNSFYKRAWNSVATSFSPASRPPNLPFPIPILELRIRSRCAP